MMAKTYKKITVAPSSIMHWCSVTAERCCLKGATSFWDVETITTVMAPRHWIKVLLELVAAAWLLGGSICWWCDWECYAKSRFDRHWLIVKFRFHATAGKDAPVAFKWRLLIFTLARVYSALKVVYGFYGKAIARVQILYCYIDRQAFLEKDSFWVDWSAGLQTRWLERIHSSKITYRRKGPTD